MVYDFFSVLELCLIFCWEFLHLCSSVILVCNFLFLYNACCSLILEKCRLAYNSVVSNPLHSYGLYSLRLLCPRDFSSKNTGVGCNSFLQGICPTERSNPSLLSLLYWQADSLPLSHMGSLKWWLVKWDWECFLSLPSLLSIFPSF